MKYIIAIITVLTIYSCRPSRHRENIEVVFYPGLVEFNDTDSGIINSIVEPDKVYTITSDDYTFLHDSLPSLTTQKLGEAISPCILLIKTDNSIYGIDANNALQNNNKAYSLSEKDAYKIKLIVHYYGKRIRDAAFFLIIMLVTFAATLLTPQNYVSSRTIQKCVEHVSTST